MVLAGPTGQWLAVKLLRDFFYIYGIELRMVTEECIFTGIRTVWRRI
jgi:hypothetical protein